MRSNYDVLGNHIRTIDTRNTELVSDKVLGINIDKFFMPSVANVIGTDLSKYKLITKGKFACNPMHVGRDERLPVALFTEETPAIMSPAYFMFEIKDESKLDPEYLMMWFRRPEFDRICWLRTDGSVRGGITWEDLCRIELPVPPMDEQKAVVGSYKAITDRIALKRQINDNLAETAQSIFKHTFVEPSKDGLPASWVKVPLYQVADLGAGGDRPEVFSEVKTSECPIPIFSNGIDNEGLYGYTDKPKVNAESVTISARGTVGFVFLRQEPFVPIVRLIYITPKNDRVTAKYLFFALRYAEMTSTGTSQQQITVPDFKNTPIIVPNVETLSAFMHRIEPMFGEINRNKEEINKLQALQSVMLQTISSN